MTITEVVALLGLVSGVAGTVLGVMNFLRDRARVVVTLQWDMETFGDVEYDPEKPWGVVTVTNVGRRAVRVSHVALRLPKGHDVTHLLHPGSVQGKTLTEASPAEVFVVSQDDLGKFAADWREVRAEVSDSTGRVSLSKRLPIDKRPSWAKL